MSDGGVDEYVYLTSEVSTTFSPALGSTAPRGLVISHDRPEGADKMTYPTGGRC